MATRSKLLNIPSAHMVIAGDMPNNFLMVPKSGFPIAMGNASDEVKAQASAVTDSNEIEAFRHSGAEVCSAPGRRMTPVTGIWLWCPG